MSDQSSSSKKVTFNGNKRMIIVFVTIFAIFGLFYLFQTSAAPRTTVSPTAVSLYISPSSVSVSQNNQFTVDVRMNTQGKNVNAVNAELTYPVDKIEFVGIDTTTSPLDFKLTDQGGNGVITIARGTTSYVTGDVLVGKVTLRAIPGRGKAQLAFTGQSAIVEAATATNILSQTYGTTITFKR